MQDSTMVKLADMAKDGFVYMAEQIKAVAPEVWKIAQTKVVASAVSDAVMTLVLWAILIPTFVLTLRHINYDDPELTPTSVVGAIFSGIVLLFTIPIGICELHQSINQLIALDYYTLITIKDLIPGL